MLLLVTYRSDELTRRHPLYALLPLLVREAHAQRLDLHPLDAAGLWALVAPYALLPAHADRLVTYLADRAEGNPFFAGELLRTLEEARVLTQDGATWVLGDLGAVGVPPLLRQVIDARVDRLGETTRALLMVAAVIGQEAPLAVWQAVAETDEATLLMVVEEATEARLLAETPNGAAIRFAHALIREALYEGTIGVRRRALHQRVAEALIGLPAPDPDAVADHFQRAGDPRAINWLDQAAERARRAYAWTMAADRLEAALARSEQVGGAPAEQGWRLLRLGLLCRYFDRQHAAAALNAAAEQAIVADDSLLAAYARFNLGLLHCYLSEPRRGIADMAAAVAVLDTIPALDEEQRARLRSWGLADDSAHQCGTLALWYAETGHLAEARAMIARARERPLDPPRTSWLDGPSRPMRYARSGSSRRNWAIPPKHGPPTSTTSRRTAWLASMARLVTR
ncbi:MAG TPA: hypothetical protein VFU78_02185, partial [Thermomicrobiales bacterium]|nr:hypothetical protein [Thermomicrobiales bacterium]